MAELEYAAENREWINEKETRMMTDVAALNLKEFEPIDYDNYKDTGTGYAPPAEGKYVGRLPMITDENFGATAEGYLKVTVDPIEIVAGNDPKAAGYKIRFTNLSAKKYKNREGSQAIDLLRACGLNLRPKTNDELKQALKMASGRTFEFALVWEAYNKDTKETTSGEQNFPLNADGVTRQSYIVDQFDPNKKWYANGKVKYFISAVKK